MAGFFDQEISFLPGVGPAKGQLFNKELGIFTFGDLIEHYPFRYEDRTRFYNISELKPEISNVQIKGTIKHMELIGHQRRKRLVAYFTDGTGEIELVWFQGIQWVTKRVQKGVEYIVYGKPTLYGSKFNIAHPEVEPATQGGPKLFLHPVYSVTEKLRNKFLDSKAISKLQATLLRKAQGNIRETLPQYLLQKFALPGKEDALIQVHFPKDNKALGMARYRLKFEEFFYLQLRLLKLKLVRTEKFRGKRFDNTQLLTQFYNEFLPFELTGAQKKVIKEVFRDMKSGHQMNRLIQGDVGSGKTIVSFICMLIVIAQGSQACMMAPTEILAEQHYQGLKEFAEQMGLNIALLTGSVKTKVRKQIHAQLEDGSLNILIGTHALIEDKVQFKDLGLAVVDEQHRFGVAQRSRLWNKNKAYIPHVLVMTATPIPRTLAMTVYGDLDVSVIDELPKGRKPIQTLHKYDSHRLWVFGFIRKQLAEGRQAYIVYPLIEESEKLDLKHLQDGYESISRAFPEYAISIVHGRQKPEDKDFEMKRFARNETKIMVATTVIEVGVNVPNASVMIIENSERFGLAQLHQLRGRVGRGADQSYCILMSDFKLTKEAKERLATMVSTTNGFEIAEKDMKLRGPGDIHGTAQSGILDLTIGDIAKDGKILQLARDAAQEVLQNDPELSKKEHQPIKQQAAKQTKNVVNWSKIS